MLKVLLPHWKLNGGLHRWAAYDLVNITGTANLDGELDLLPLTSARHAPIGCSLQIVANWMWAWLVKGHLLLKMAGEHSNNAIVRSGSMVLVQGKPVCEKGSC